jgi:hypothetical protein
MGGHFFYFSAHRSAITDSFIVSGPGDQALESSIDPLIMLGQLGELLTGVDYLKIAVKRSILPELVVPDDPEEREEFLYEFNLDPEPGSWEEQLAELRCAMAVVVLRNRIRNTLAAIPPGQWKPVAERWVTIEELRRDSTKVDDVLPFLEQISGLARSAILADQRLYCWTFA